MLNIKQFRELLVRPTLQAIGLWSMAAENLIVGTALQESNLEYLAQINGPALGLLEIEPPTYVDICNRLKGHNELLPKILQTLNMQSLPTDPHALIGNITLSIIICRIKYYFCPSPLPDANDINGLANYYKIIYNGPGKASTEHFIELYNKYGLN